MESSSNGQRIRKNSFFLFSFILGKGIEDFKLLIKLSESSPNTRFPMTPPEKIIFPCVIELATDTGRSAGQHWVSVMCDLVEKTIEYVDSMAYSRQASHDRSSLMIPVKVRKIQ